MLDAGSAQEVAVRSERFTTVVRFLTEEYFVAVAVKPEGNFGKARFLLRMKAPTLAADLA